MEFVNTSLYYDQEIRALQVQDVHHAFPGNFIDHSFHRVRFPFYQYPQEVIDPSQNTLAFPIEKSEFLPFFSSPKKEQVKEETNFTPKELKNLKLWKTQQRFGDFVEGTKILPCKTFLCEEKWLDYLDVSDHFHLRDLAEGLEKKGLKVGLILDLNRSTTYYNFTNIQKECSLLSETKYRKFKLENGSVPCEEAVKEVCQLLKEAYLKDEVVIVHCYNGINRTGYLICEFLCSFLGMDAETAISKFESARKYKMEHECMTNQLKMKYQTAGSK